MKKLICTTALCLAVALPATSGALAQMGAQDNMTWEQDTTTGGDVTRGTEDRAAGETADKKHDLSQSTVREIEQSLNERGYDIGEVDGILNNQDVAALENFQRAQGLEATGEPDSDTLDALEVDTADAQNGQMGTQPDDQTGGIGQGLDMNMETDQGDY